MRWIIHIRHRYLMPALLLIALSCAAAAPDNDALTVAWRNYTDSLHISGLQAGCRPRHYRPPPGMVARGTVLLIHGFGACPQQYFQLGPATAAAGYEVLVPLLPGHGHLPDANGKEDLSTLPAGKDWRVYGEFAARMNSIMALASGEHVIVGYSLGGGVALNAILREPQLYDRALLAAPLLAIRGGRAIEHIVKFLGDVPFLKDLRVKTPALRRECRSWSDAGRAGFCDYRYKHAAALVHLEEQNHEWITQTQLTMPMQLILARGDHTISNEAIREFSRKQIEHGPLGLCYLPEDVPHEVLTPYENIGRKMYWLGEL
ncbi:MAG TPA: alpha/beta fold hydrolase, partial [Chromatiales bacterium]|nr:alpha/beta fold hydrolase [Chromatiales bacterium]